MVTYNGQLSPGVREVIALLISKESLQDVRVRETLLSKRFTNSYREKSYKQSTLLVVTTTGKEVCKWKHRIKSNMQLLALNAAFVFSRCLHTSECAHSLYCLHMGHSAYAYIH